MSDMGSSDGNRSTLILQRLLKEPDDEQAFAKFAAKYLPRMKLSCRRIGLQAADADDISAAVLLKFYEKHEFKKFVFRSKDKFNRWLHTVVKRAVLTFIRDRNRKPDAWSLGDSSAQEALDHVTAELAGDLATSCEEDLAAGNKALAVVRRRVDAKTLRAFSLMVFDERKGTDVAVELGMSPAAVWKARHRVAKMLQQEFKRLQQIPEKIE